MVIQTSNRTRIYNCDLRFELFPETGELLAVECTFYSNILKIPMEIFYRITQKIVSEIR